MRKRVRGMMEGFSESGGGDDIFGSGDCRFYTV